MSPNTDLRFSRRALVGSGLSGAALLPLGSSQRVVAAPPQIDTLGALGAVRRQEATPAASTPANWRTWHLDSPDELRPAAPDTPSEDEIANVLGFQEQLTDEMTATIAKWGTGPAVLAWSAMTPDLHKEFMTSGIRQGRNLALLHTAMSDAALAAWDAQLAHGRPGPAATDDRVVAPTGLDPATPSFPSEHAVVAGAAAKVLTYLFPDAAAGRFTDLATEAAESRIWAGAAFRADIKAGLELGEAVGERAIARGQADGSDAAFDPAMIPGGPGLWQPTPPAMAEVPVEPRGGSWKTWILDGGDQFRPAAPPEYGSPTWRSELEMVQEIVARRTLDEEATARWWQSGDPLSTQWAHDLILKAGLDLPHAARVLAYLSVGFADAVIAVWDAKYTWWTVRPITEDPDLVTAFPTPPYPAYPSGYSAVAGAGELILGHFFPEAAGDLADLSWEAARSRAWAGIHYEIDNEIGLSMGRQVGRLVAAAARADEPA